MTTSKYKVSCDINSVSKSLEGTLTDTTRSKLFREMCLGSIFGCIYQVPYNGGVTKPVTYIDFQTNTKFTSSEELLYRTRENYIDGLQDGLFNLTKDMKKVN